MEEWYIVRSRIVGGNAIRQLVDGIARHVRKKDFLRYDSSQPNGFSLVGRRLEALDMFYVHHRVGVQFWYDREYAEKEYRTMCDIVRPLCGRMTRTFVSAYMSTLMKHSGIDVLVSYTLLIGYNAPELSPDTPAEGGSFFCAFSLGSISIKDPQSMKVVCKDILIREFEVMGLGNSIRFVEKGSDYILESEAPYSLRKGPVTVLSPSCVDIRGFSSFDDALTHGQRFLNGFDWHCKTIQLFGWCNEETYNSIRQEVSDIEQTWIYRGLGHLADWVQPFADPRVLPADAPTVVPIFGWWEPSYEVFFQGRILRMPDGLCLEIFSNCKDPKKLMKRARDATGMDFRFVDQHSDLES